MKTAWLALLFAILSCILPMVADAVPELIRPEVLALGFVLCLLGFSIGMIGIKDPKTENVCLMAIVLAASAGLYHGGFILSLIFTLVFVLVHMKKDKLSTEHTGENHDG